jgi:hypothetical protein
MANLEIDLQFQNIDKKNLHILIFIEHTNIHVLHKTQIYKTKSMEIWIKFLPNSS